MVNRLDNVKMRDAIAGRRIRWVAGAAPGWFLVLAAAAAAQKPGVSLELGASVLEVGETVEAQLVCTNTGAPSLPAFAVPDGIELSVANPNPAVSSMTSIVNGQMTRRQTYTYSLRLTGERAGTYVVGPIAVEADGRTYESKTVTVTVREPADGDKPDGDKLVFVRIHVEPRQTRDKRSVYVTQTVTATLTIGIRKVYLRDQMVDYDNLLQTVDARASTLAGFGPRFTPGRLTLSDSDGRPHEYVVYRDTKEIRAEQVGPLRIGPVFLKVTYPTAFRRSFWGIEPSRTTRVTARAEAVVIDVKAPPTTGRPLDFTGAIGRFTLDATAKPVRVEQGQPVTLTIAIEGSDIEGVAGPDLRDQPELTSRFDFVADEVSGDVVAPGRKVFRRAIFPRASGEQTIPPISWSYFDPRRPGYVTLTTDPIPITVDPPSEDATGAAGLDLESDGNGGASRPSQLTVLRGGLAPNYVDTDRLLADQSFSAPWREGTGSGPTIYGVLAAPPFVWLATLFVARRRARYASDRGLARRSRALRLGQRMIDRARREATPAAQMDGLARAMIEYLGHRFDLPPGALTPSEAYDLIASRAGDEATGREVSEFLAECEALRFAPIPSGGDVGAGSAGSDAAHRPPEIAAARLREWMKRIERARAAREGR